MTNPFIDYGGRKRDSAGTAFDDMPNDLDFGDDRPEVTEDNSIANERLRTKARFEEICEKCKGTGQFYGWSGRYVGPCRACKGQGKRLFAQPKATRERNRANAAANKVNRELERAAEVKEHAEQWKADNKAEAAWLHQNANSLEFAGNLNEALHKWGYLTEGQLAAVQRCIEKDRARAVVKAAEATKPNPPVNRLDRLHQTMQRHAKFYAGRLTLSRRNADELIWIKLEGQERVVGKIDSGVLTLWNRPGADLDYVRDMLAEFDADPLTAAKKYGKLSGRCCVCGRDLTNDNSIDEGIGPVCAGRL